LLSVGEETENSAIPVILYAGELGEMTTLPIWLVRRIDAVDRINVA
jgi:hypothetical protein